MSNGKSGRGPSRRKFIAAASGALLAVGGLLIGKDWLLRRSSEVPPETTQLKAQTVSYDSEGARITAYEIGPLSLRPMPGLIIVHENRGIGDHYKDVAGRFARSGYIALVPDLISRSGGTAANEEENRSRLSRIPDKLIQADLNSSMKYLKSLPSVREDRIGVVGFCWGGRHSLLMACLNRELAASVVFYGGPVNTRPTEIAHMNPIEMVDSISAPLLAHYGEIDQAIPLGQARALENRLKEKKRDYELYIYEGAGHAFFNDTRPSYRVDAAKLAWERTVSFLSRHLKY